MKRSGFIATSLIYSFFLAFITIIAVLLNNYVANKTILERYNDSVLEDLNNDTFSVKVIMDGGSARTKSNMSINLQNLVQDATFLTVSNADSPWIKVGTFTTSYVSSSTPKYLSIARDTLANAYLYTELPIMENNKYYVKIKNIQPGAVQTQTFIPDMPSCKLQTITSNTWKEYSTVDCFSSTTNYEAKLIIGYSDLNYDSDVSYADIMVVNLAGFGNNIPNKEWLDRNIDFFEGSVSFLVEENIKKNSELSISIFGTDTLSNPEVECSSKKGNWEMDSSTFKDNLTDGTFDLKSITDDITCTVRWNP